MSTRVLTSARFQWLVILEIKFSYKLDKTQMGSFDQSPPGRALKHWEPLIHIHTYAHSYTHTLKKKKSHEQRKVHERDVTFAAYQRDLWRHIPFSHCQLFVSHECFHAQAVCLYLGVAVGVYVHEDLYFPTCFDNWAVRGKGRERDDQCSVLPCCCKFGITCTLKSMCLGCCMYVCIVYVCSMCCCLACCNIYVLCMHAVCVAACCMYVCA